MKKSSRNLLPGILIFTIGFLSALFAQLYPETKILIRITFIISLTYLLLGWRIFNNYIPDINPVIRFIPGYLYASLFITLVFGATKWPLASTIIAISPLWIIGLILFIVLLRKQMLREALIQFIIETAFLLFLDIYLLIKA